MYFGETPKKMFADQFAGLPNEVDLERGDRRRGGRAGTDQTGAAPAIYTQVHRLEVAGHPWCRR